MLTRKLALSFIIYGFALTVAQGRTNSAVGGGTVQVQIHFVLPSGEAQALPGVTVTLFDADKKQVQQVFTGDQGEAILKGASTGEYVLQFEMPGFKTIRRKVVVRDAETAMVEAELPIEEITSTVDVVAANEKEDRKQTQLPVTLQQQLLKSAPLVNERFQDALPLVPGVVRGPDGLLSLNGARPNQSGLLVNSINVTDPVTGQYAMELPIEAIESVKVYSNPYSVEFGKFTGAVTSIETRQGTNEWKYLVTNFIPRLRWREGTIMGFESFTPRVAVQGPLIRNKLWLIQNFEYRNILTEVPSLPDLQNETQLETFDSFTKLGWNITDYHQLGMVFSLYPQNLKYVNLDTFHPQEVTPNFRQRGFFLAFSEHTVINLNSLLDTTFSIKQYNANIWANSTDAMTIRPAGWSGGFFNSQDRDSRRYEFSQALSLRQYRRYGTHDLKVGYTVSRAAFDSIDLNRQVLIRRSDDTLSQRIDFLGAGYLDQGITEITAYAQDHWQPSQSLTLNLGGRLDWDSLAKIANVAPRLSFAWLPFPGNTRTVVRGGLGLFFDKIPLNVGVFNQYQRMRLTTFGADGVSVIAGPTEFQNVVKDGRFKNPYSLTWNVEIDREIARGLLARFAYQQRHNYRDFVLNTVDSSAPALVLSNDGQQRYREFLASLKYSFRQADQMAVSYVRSSDRGNLNNFEQYLGNYHYPVIRADEFGPLQYDVPNRVLVTGNFNLKWGILAFPVLEWRDGFPYSIVDENQDFVGRRNLGGRFPDFVSLDVQVMKKVSFKFLKKTYHTRVGIKIFNITGHWNPRDVQSNIDDPDFGQFYNSIGRRFRGKFEFDF